MITKTISLCTYLCQRAKYSNLKIFHSWKKRHYWIHCTALHKSIINLIKSLLTKIQPNNLISNLQKLIKNCIKSSFKTLMSHFYHFYPKSPKITPKSLISLFIFFATTNTIINIKYLPISNSNTTSRTLLTNLESSSNHAESTVKTHIFMLTMVLEMSPKPIAE